MHLAAKAGDMATTLPPVAYSNLLSCPCPAALDAETARAWEGNLYGFDARQVEALMLVEQSVLDQMRSVDKVGLVRRLGRIDEQCETGELEIGPEMLCE